MTMLGILVLVFGSGIHLHGQDSLELDHSSARVRTAVEPGPVVAIPGNVLRELKARDLSQYDAGGTIEVLVAPAINARDHTVKEFVWSHWRDQQRGYVRVVGRHPEGHTSVSEFLIEPDRRGQWVLVIMSYSDADWQRSDGEISSYADLVRMNPKDQRQFYDRNEDVSPDAYWLSFMWQKRSPQVILR